MQVLAVGAGGVLTVMIVDLIHIIQPRRSFTTNAASAWSVLIMTYHVCSTLAAVLYPGSL